MEAYIPQLIDCKPVLVLRPLNSPPLLHEVRLCFTDLAFTIAVIVLIDYLYLQNRFPLSFNYPWSGASEPQVEALMLGLPVLVVTLVNHHQDFLGLPE